MRFEARAPDDSINVSRVHPLREALVLVIGLSAVMALVAVIAALGVDFAVRLIPPDFEARVFADLPTGALVEVAPEGEGSARLETARRLVERLAAQWPECPYRFRVDLMASPEVNALALPGGRILLTPALLEEVESENELAMVLGHELGHFRNRDHLRGMGRAMVYGLALAAVLGRTSGPATDLATLGGEIASRGFDREQESRADEFGLELVARLYGHVAGSEDFFQRLALESGDSGSPLVVYLRTHPRLQDRGESLRTLAVERGFRLEGVPRPLEGS